MKLSDGELRPGTVLEVLSVEGVIKASVPGLFSSADQEVLPPIYPFCVGGSNTFSTPNVGDECWVLFFHNNPEQLYWFRKDNFATNNGNRNKGGSKKIGGNIQDQTNVEVLSSRESGMGWATIYFSDGTGWIIQNQDAIMQLDPDGNILLSTGAPHGDIEISDEGISLGTKGGSAHPACYGDRVADLFDNIIKTLQAIQNASNANPYTIAIGNAITPLLSQYENDAEYIKSDYVTLD